MWVPSYFLSKLFRLDPYLTQVRCKLNSVNLFRSGYTHISHILVIFFSCTFWKQVPFKRRRIDLLLLHVSIVFIHAARQLKPSGLLLFICCFIQRVQLFSFCHTGFVYGLTFFFLFKLWPTTLFSFNLSQMFAHVFLSVVWTQNRLVSQPESMWFSSLNNHYSVSLP